MLNLNSYKCDELEVPEMRSLCKELRLELAPRKTKELSKAFTGVPDLDITILDKLSDEELVDACMTNVYVNNLCNNEYFWMTRLTNAFKVLGEPQDIREKYKPDNVSWRDYFWLADSDENMKPEFIPDIINRQRTDLLKILHFYALLDEELLPQNILETLHAPVTYTDKFKEFYILSPQRFTEKYEIGRHEMTIKDILWFVGNGNIPEKLSLITLINLINLDLYENNALFTQVRSEKSYFTIAKLLSLSIRI